MKTLNQSHILSIRKNAIVKITESRTFQTTLKITWAGGRKKKKNRINKITEIKIEILKTEILIRKFSFSPFASLS